jgi:hypothetical protein
LYQSSAITFTPFNCLLKFQIRFFQSLSGFLEQNLASRVVRVFRLFYNWEGQRSEGGRTRREERGERREERGERRERREERGDERVREDIHQISCLL